ncbi:MAG: hypothetical protein NTY11_03080 [Candidatus Parcubacteria bacterium]|nr:hypothetical protein [Candidatus Parcubacteria bacterium]
MKFFRKQILISLLIITGIMLVGFYYPTNNHEKVEAADCGGTASYQITGTDVCSDEYSPSYYPCSNVSNGITTDYWFGSATGAPKWTYGNLDSKKCISAVRVWIYSYDVPQTMNIDVSDDASTWTRVVTSWTVSTPDTWVEKTFSDEYRCFR